MIDQKTPPWLSVQRGEAPLVVSMPHTGTELVGGIEAGLESPWLARRDADWWVDKQVEMRHEDAQRGYENVFLDAATS